MGRIPIPQDDWLEYMSGDVNSIMTSMRKVAELLERIAAALECANNINDPRGAQCWHETQVVLETGTFCRVCGVKLRSPE